MIYKSRLIETLTGKNRGLLASKYDQQVILAAIAQVEDYNPNPCPFEAKELLNGNWRLLYTTSQELLRIDSFPFLKLGEIYQCIRVQDTAIYNIAEVSGLPLLEGIVSVVAQFEAVSEKRVNVKFNRSILGLQSLIGYQSPNRLIAEIESGKKFTAVDFKIQNREQKGWLDITYLDENLRIGRGNQGNVFVLTKV
ncbi:MULTISPECIES: PAP/fibrillin family protein [unclassified Okeania]|uniref:PAP/fibrillin family protein n=1 Tax=unclassified Okeania TaxID=2634635 RepID=UPI0013B9B49B|nr:MULTISPECIES: PAP/fibrillin family protein [unclassified Okeania]NET13475.1 fibrillin [Okeania sp. SIO1H6]NES77203.1 fibrillin [Okeania sp. SIO1H4]NES93000.1 fibrillin [Okeania sp. SIO2B9]NET19268.1 fibrillin [Okeania sp. SIO1H5]NET74877.1 fibrillin [Okeania sp. SIO1F9]